MKSKWSCQCKDAACECAIGHKWTPLHEAIYFNKIAEVRKLIPTLTVEEVNARDGDQATPLILAISNNRRLVPVVESETINPKLEIVDFIRAGADVNVDGFLALDLAVNDGNLPLVNLLIKAGIDLNPNPISQALASALSKNQDEIACAIIEKFKQSDREELKRNSDYYLYFLYIIISSNDRNQVAISLLRAGIVVSAFLWMVNNCEIGLLNFAILRQNFTITLELITTCGSQIDLKEIDDKGKTALEELRSIQPTSPVIQQAIKALERILTNLDYAIIFYYCKVTESEKVNME